VVEAKRRAIETVELEERIRALEEVRAWKAGASPRAISLARIWAMYGSTNDPSEAHLLLSSVYFADLVERQPELLAHHLTSAGNSERAVEQWLKAGGMPQRDSLTSKQLPSRAGSRLLVTGEPGAERTAKSSCNWR
jgi:hypothetical protein